MMSAKPLVLAVNNNHRNLELLEQFLVKNGYAVTSAASLDEFAQALQGGESIRLALVDITGFDPSIWEQCKGLHEKGIPFLVVSPRQSNAVRQTGMLRGARDVLVKPLANQELLALMQNLLEQN